MGKCFIRLGHAMGIFTRRHGLAFATHLTWLTGGCLLVEDSFDPESSLAAISRATVIDSRRATVVGDGAFDLGREQIDFTVSPSVKNAGLVSLTVPIRISGSMEDPSITLHSGKLAKKTVGAVADLAESIISIVGIGNTSKAQNPCVMALAAPPRRHSMNQTSQRPSTARR